MAAQLLIYGGIAGLQMAGGYFASQNIKESARINQEIANMNAEFAELDAYDMEMEGYTQQARYQSVIDNTLAQQQLAMTAADIDTSYGTAASIQEETRFIGEMNLMEIEKEAQEKALGITRQAREFRMSGVMGVAEAEQQASSVMFNAATGAAQTGATGYKRSR